MSDSDEPLSNNVFWFQNENSTTYSAKGPGFNFQKKFTSSIPNNFNFPQHSESQFKNRSMYGMPSRYRETSPMSIMSACDAQRRTFNHSYSQRAMSSQQSMYNERVGSAMSVRSIDSSSSTCAKDIAMALKSVDFNKYDVKVIQEAYIKFMRGRTRRRVQKKRNLKHFLRGYRKTCGNDSGELGSDSSISSHESSRYTSDHKNAMSRCRSTNTDVSELRQALKDNTMYRDSNYIKQNYHIKPASINKPLLSVPNSNQNNCQDSQNKPRKMSTTYYKDRFNGFSLPSQRFNLTSSIIQENSQYDKNVTANKNNAKHQTTSWNHNDNSDSSDKTISEKPKPCDKISRKRSLDSDEYILPQSKRKKDTTIKPPSLPHIPSHKNNMSHNVNTNNTEEANKFVFAVPTFPPKKSNHSKSRKEKVITRSKYPQLDFINAPFGSCGGNETPATEDTVSMECNNTEIDKEEEGVCSSTQNPTEVSMRPSFIKRKLFSQTMDVTEKKNDISLNSPQNSNYGIMSKDKNKRRKQHTTTQPCLSRDVPRDDSNLLDLICKIVPADQMNITNMTSRTSQRLSQNQPEEEDSTNTTCKESVTSKISTNNYIVDDVDKISDTYTDEEVLNETIKQATNVNTSKGIPSTVGANLTIRLERLPMASTSRLINSDLTKTMHEGPVKRFWDTDFESDVEYLNSVQVDSGATTEPQNNKRILTRLNAQNPKKTKSSNLHNTSLNSTVKKFDHNSIKIRSHTTDSRKRHNMTNDETVSIELGTKKPKLSAISTLHVVKKPTNKKNKASVKVVSESPKAQIQNMNSSMHEKSAQPNKNKHTQPSPQKEHKEKRKMNQESHLPPDGSKKRGKNRKKNNKHEIQKYSHEDSLDESVRLPTKNGNEKGIERDKGSQSNKRAQSNRHKENLNSKKSNVTKETPLKEKNNNKPPAATPNKYINISASDRRTRSSDRIASKRVHADATQSSTDRAARLNDTSLATSDTDRDTSAPHRALRSRLVDLSFSNTNDKAKRRTKGASKDRKNTSGDVPPNHKYEIVNKHKKNINGIKNIRTYESEVDTSDLSFSLPTSESFARRARPRARARAAANTAEPSPAPQMNLSAVSAVTRSLSTTKPRNDGSLPKPNTKRLRTPNKKYFNCVL